MKTSKKLKKSKEVEKPKKLKKLKSKKSKEASGSSFADIPDNDFKKKRVKSPDGLSESVTSLTDFARDRRRVQKDQRIAALLQVADEIVLDSQLDGELREFFVTSRDRKLGTYAFSGVDASFTRPRRNQIAIAEVLLTVQAHRDRVIDIQTSLLGFNNKLQSAKRIITELLYERYPDELKKRGALTVQGIFIDAVLEPITEKREIVEMYLKRVDIILKNLDNSHFAFREVGQIGNSIIARTEGGHNVARG